MRKVLSVILCMIALVVITDGVGEQCAFADVAVNAENFPDENFRSYVSINFDSDSDGSLSDAEIAAVTRISLGNGSISSLTGVEYFTALTELLCSGNQLTALDVSNNTALTKLDCWDNQLTALDVSKNTALTVLTCSENQLTALDVSHNTALTTLYCFSNQLTALDVSKNTALMDLHCEYNQLTALDLSTNTALTLLDCNSNQLAALNLSTNTALTELLCWSNDLTALDVSHNTALTKLWCFTNQLTALNLSNNTALKELSCHSNQLIALDLSKNTALTDLWCNSNQLTTLDLSTNTALWWMDCSSNQLTTLDLSKNTALTWLWCNSNQLTALDVSKNTALMGLYCSSNQLTALDVSTNTALTSLDCYSQTLSIASVDSTGDTTYPYSLNLSALGVSLDLDPRVHDLAITDSNGSTVNHNTDSSTGIVYFAAAPSTITYSYDVKMSGSTQYMPVTVTFTSASTTDNPQPSIPTSTVVTAPAVISTFNSNPSLLSALLSALRLPAGTALIDNSTLIVGAQTPVATAQAALRGLTNVFSNAASAVLAFVLPAMSSPTSGIVVIGLPEANINRYRGRRMSFIMVPKSRATASGFSAAAADDVQVGQFIDADGSVITGALPASGDIYAAVYMEANVEYDPMIVEGELTAAGNSGNTDSNNGGIGTGTAIDSTTFPNAKFRSYVAEKIDTNGDGYLSDSERLAVTSIDLTNYEYSGTNSGTSLAGIEQFTNLGYLNCISEDLNGLDVSKNTALVYLDCSQNKLTALDVSSNTDLSTLQIASNQVTELDLSKNTKLQWLWCGANQLSDLDLMQNTALLTLACGGNSLTSLNLSSNVELIDLECGYNQLAALDLTLNTKLLSLDCNHNKLTALDLSSNTALTSLSCYSQDITIANVEPSSDSAFPYSLNLNTLKVSLGISADVADFISRVHSLDIRNSSGSTVNHRTDSSAGIIYFASMPSIITYTYDTKTSIKSSVMDTSSVMDVTVRILNTSGGRDSPSAETPAASTPSEPSAPSTPSEPSTNYDPYEDYQSTPVAETPLSEDITPTSDDLTPTSSDTSPGTPDTPSDDPNNIDPYDEDRWSSAVKLSTAEALLGLLSSINSGYEPAGRYYALTVDIDLSGETWQGIGTEAHPFTGHFDGSGRTITCSASIGFFGIINTDGVAVRRLTVRRTNASASGVTTSASVSECAGGIAQELISGIIEDCNFTGTITAYGEDSSAGGIVGELSGGTIRNCKTLLGSEINADYSAGGIAGYVSDGEITECSSNAAITAQYSGGIAGFSETDRTNINSNSFTEADYEVGNDASSLILTPASQNVQEGSMITAITFNLEGIRSWSFTSDLSGLTSRDNSISGTIPYDTPAGVHTITVNAVNTDGARIAGQATINVTRINVNGRRNFMDYTFDVPAALRSGIASFFGVDNVYQLTGDEIVSETWQPGRADLQEIAGMNLRVILNLPEIRPARSGVYLLKLTLLDVSAGSRLELHGITGSSQVNSSALENMEYAFFDESGREIKEVPAGKVVYAALRLSSGRTHRGVVTAPKELGLGSIQAFTPDEALLGKIADTVNISADKLNVLEDRNIKDPQDPTQAMLDEMASRESDPVGKMNTLVVSRDGYYVLKVTLSDDLYEQHVKGVKAEDLKAYVLYDNGEAESSEVSASFITGLLNTWELLTLKGEKLEFGAKEFLMVGFLNAGTPFSVYLTKLILALLMGGCDAGLGLVGLGVAAGAVILILRRRR